MLRNNMVMWGHLVEAQILEQKSKRTCKVSQPHKYAVLLSKEDRIDPSFKTMDHYLEKAGFQLFSYQFWGKLSAI